MSDSTHSVMSSLRPVVCPGQDPPPWEMWFLGVPGVFLSTFCFQNLYFFFQNLFHPNIFFTSKKLFPLSLIYAFLDVSCHPECSKISFTQFFSSMSYGWSKVQHNASKHYSLGLVLRLDSCTHNSKLLQLGVCASFWLGIFQLFPL